MIGRRLVGARTGGCVTQNLSFEEWDEATMGTLMETPDGWGLLATNEENPRYIGNSADKYVDEAILVERNSRATDGEYSVYLKRNSFETEWEDSFPDSTTIIPYYLHLFGTVKIPADVNRLLFDYRVLALDAIYFYVYINGVGVTNSADFTVADNFKTAHAWLPESVRSGGIYEVRFVLGRYSEFRHGSMLLDNIRFEHYIEPVNPNELVINGSFSKEGVASGEGWTLAGSRHGFANVGFLFTVTLNNRATVISKEPIDLTRAQSLSLRVWCTYTSIPFTVIFIRASDNAVVFEQAGTAPAVGTWVSHRFDISLLSGEHYLKFTTTSTSTSMFDYIAISEVSIIAE